MEMEWKNQIVETETEMDRRRHVRTTWIIGEDDNMTEKMGNSVRKPKSHRTANTLGGQNVIPDAANDPWEGEPSVTVWPTYLPRLLSPRWAYCRAVCENTALYGTDYDRIARLR